MRDRKQDGGTEAVRPKARSTTRMPEDSVFYEKVIPAVLVGLGIVTVVLILLALAVLLRVVPFQ